MRWRLVLAVLALSCGTLAAQTPVFRSAVDLVQVDVVVTDKNNHPISDLTQADFSITEAGKPQTVQTFQHVSIPATHRTIDLNQPPAPSPDVATNAPASDRSRVWVMVVDDQHIIEEDIVQTKEVMTDFLRSLPPDDRVAMIFAGRSDLSVNFTNDIGRLFTAVNGVRGAFGFGLDAMGIDASGRGGPLQGSDQLAHARTTTFALRNAAQALAGSAYIRRAIVFVSGFSVIRPPRPRCTECQQLEFELQNVYDFARRADVPIYTLDPRGMINLNPEIGARRRVSPEVVRPNVLTQQDHLRDIADATGGLALMNIFDRAQAVDAIVADNSDFYLLGYSPDPAVHDGKYHPISVKVNRPGAIVRARAGYVAATNANTVATTQEALDKAIGAGVDVSGLELHAFAAPVAAASTGKGMATVVTVDVVYPTSGIPSAIDDTLRYTVLALDADGKTKASVARDLHVAGSSAAGRPMTVRFDELLDLPSQALTLRIGVASPTVGRAGMLQLPVDVMDPTRGKLALGGIAVGIVGGPAGLTSGQERLRGLMPFQPITYRSFSQADTLRVFAPVFWGDKDDAVDVTVTVSGARAGTPRRIHLVGAPVQGGRRQAAANVTVPLGDVGPGPCSITVSAALASGATTSRVVPCTIEPPR